MQKKAQQLSIISTESLLTASEADLWRHTCKTSRQWLMDEQRWAPVPPMRLPHFKDKRPDDFTQVRITLRSVVLHDTPLEGQLQWELALVMHGCAKHCRFDLFAF